MNVESLSASTDRLLRALISDSGLELSYRVIPQPRGSIPALVVEFTGADMNILLRENAELLLAMEQFGCDALRLGPAERELLSFNASGFKEARNQAITLAAAQGVRAVREHGRAHHYPPGSSRERRLLHLAIAEHGGRSVSEGEGRTRHVVLLPAR